MLIKDFGLGTGQIPIKKGGAYLDELEGSGLGLYLIDTLIDKVEYKKIEKVGSELKFIKYLNKECGNGN